MYDFTQFIDISLLGILIVIGKIIKSAKIFNKIPNKYIVVIIPIIGVIIEAITKHSLSMEIINYGIFTGFAATGVHQFGKQIIIGIPDELKYSEDTEEEFVNEDDEEEEDEEF